MFPRFDINYYCVYKFNKNWSYKGVRNVLNYLKLNETPYYYLEVKMCKDRTLSKNVCSSYNLEPRQNLNLSDVHKQLNLNLEYDLRNFLK